MTLQQIAQILGAIGVIASLIYVAVQIRNNARAVRAAAYQQLSAAMASSWETLANNGESISIMLRGGDDFDSLGRIEKARFRLWLMAYARKYENAWFQYKIGTLREKDWLAIAADMDSLFSLPGSRTAWPLVSNRSSVDFRAVVAAVVERQAATSAAGAD